MNSKYCYYSSAGTVNSSENPPTNQGVGKGSIIRKMIRVRIYILEFWWYFRLVVVQFFFLICEGTEDLCLVSLASKHCWILSEVSPGTMKNSKVRIKYVLEVLTNLILLKSDSKLNDCVWRFFCEFFFFCFRKCSNTRYIKLTAQNYSV